MNHTWVSSGIRCEALPLGTRLFGLEKGWKQCDLNVVSAEDIKILMGHRNFLAILLPDCVIKVLYQLGLDRVECVRPS